MEPFLLGLLSHDTGDLDLVLISPSGVRIDPTVAAGDPDIDFEEFGAFDEALQFEVYAINNPEVGVWTLEVSAPSVVNPSGEEPYFLTGWLTDTPIQLEAETDKPSYQSGDPIVIHATLLDSGAPITGVDVAAKVVLPDNSFFDITLSDDGTGDDQTAGDGIYSSRFSATLQAGLYRVLVTANGQPPTPFSQEVLLVAPVSASASQFSGAFADFGNNQYTDKPDGLSRFKPLLRLSNIKENKKRFEANQPGGLLFLVSAMFLIFSRKLKFDFA